MKRLITIAALSVASCNQQPTSDEKSPKLTASAIPAGAAGESASKTISCHELIGGRPSPEANTYRLVGSKLYAQVPAGERRLISAEGQQVDLGRHEDDEGPEDSFASHTLQGDVLTRTVLWQRPGQAPRTAFVERYDFSKQTVVDADTGEDTCYHDAPPDGRTQEQAEWEALSGTGRGDSPSSNDE